MICTKLIRTIAFRCLAFSLAIGATATAFAETGVTNVINGTTNTVTGTYMVGTNGASNFLTITNVGVLLISSTGIIGNSAISSNNAVWVVSPGSLWSNAGNLVIGATGSFNSLTISAHGYVVSGNGYIGYDPASSNNSVGVTGSGSVWNAGSLYVGFFGSNNTLNINNGGIVSATNFVLGAGGTLTLGGFWDSGGMLTTSQLTVTNTGSSVNFYDGTLTSGGTLWSNGSAVTLGVSDAHGIPVLNLVGGTHSFGNGINLGARWGSGGRAMITNGAQVFVNGSVSSPDYSGGGSVFVADPGSRLVVAGSIGLGSYMSGGSHLTVSNGAQVFSGGAWLGSSAYSGGNGVLITGPGSVWSNGGLSIGWAYESWVDDNHVIVRDGGRLITAGTIIGDISVGKSGSSSENSVEVSGTNSVWLNTGGLEIRSSSWRKNWVAASNGGTVEVQGTLKNSAVVTLLDGNALISSFINGSNEVYYGGLLHYGPGTFSMTGGTLTVAGALSNLTSARFEIAAGTGSIQSIYNESAITLSGGTLTAGLLVSTNAGSVFNLNGGLLRSGGSSMGGSNVFAVGNGVLSATLDLMGGTHNFANNLFINTNGWLTGTGAITGSVAASGVIAPGHSAGAITEVGDLTLLGGSAVNMELGGANAWLYDHFDLTGMFNIGGTLAVSLINGYTPLAGDRFDLFDFSGSRGAFTVMTLPDLGSSLAWNLGSLYSNGEIFVENRGSGSDVKAAMTSPTAGGTLTTDPVSFTWNAGGGVTQYALWMGSATNSYDIYAAAEGTNLSKTLTLPLDGRALYVRLWSLIRGSWQYNDYSYWLAVARGAAMLSPANGSTNSGATVTFTWDAGVGVTGKILWMGSTPGSCDLYAGAEPTSSRTLTLPVDGRRLYATLWSKISGRWQYTSYSYRAFLPTKARFTGLANGATLTGTNVTLNWDAGAGVSQYALWVGTRAGTYDLYAANLSTNLSGALTGLPADGRQLYVRLWSLINGTWKLNDYEFKAFADPASQLAQMTSPTNGTVLVTASTNFTWSAGTGVSQYALWEGSAPGDYDLNAVAVGTNRTQALNVPLDGGAVYVRLWSWVSGTWKWNDYEYGTSAGGAAVKGQMTSHASGATLDGAATAFGWNAGVGVSGYALWVGNTPGSYDLYAAQLGTNRTQTVTGLPVDGGPVYVRLWSLISGVWKFNDYFYSAYLAP